MRYLQTITFIFLIFMTACNDGWNSSDAVKRFIPGTYTRQVKNRFVIALDTIIIQRAAGNNYLIVDRTAYQRIRNGKLSPEQFIENNLNALYDEKSKNLYEQRLGKTFSFDPPNKRLFEGGSEYGKVIP